MKYNDTISKVTTVALTAAISSIATYLLCTDISDDREEELRDRIAELERKEQEYMVTRRVSEQMEDIAYQQKAVSDEQRERAERQSMIAITERGKAEQERGLARRAELYAVLSAQQADSMRVEAERQSFNAKQERQDAIAARRKADTLFYNSMARFLAQNAIVQQNAGTRDLATLLSYAAWHYTKSYGGDLYQQDLFTSLLYTANNSMQHTGQLKSNVRDITRVGNEYIAVSEYGEIAILQRNVGSVNGTVSYRTDIVYSKPSLHFRAVQTNGNNTCYALDASGTMIIKSFNSKRTAPKRLSLPNGIWEHLLRRSDGMMLAVARNMVAWINDQGTKVLRTQKINADIAEAGLIDDKLMLFCSSGVVKVFDEYAETSSIHFSLPRNAIVTAMEYVPDRHWLLLGTNNGTIYIYNRSHKLITTLHGHTKAITHLSHLSHQLVSSSYDHTLRLWDLRNTSSIINPVNIGYDHLPLCFTSDVTQSTLFVGLEGGDIQSVSVSVEKNAESTRHSITRELTSDEWQYYIGKEVPYTHFKDVTP